MIRIERRLTRPRWLVAAVPLGSLAVAIGFMTVCCGTRLKTMNEPSGE